MIVNSQTTNSYNSFLIFNPLPSSLQFSVFSTKSTDKGTYYITIMGYVSGSPTNGYTNTTFKLKLIENIGPPYFETILATLYVEVGSD